MRPRLPLPALAVLLALAYPALGQVPPEKAVGTLKASDGLQVELFAAEPLFVNPTCFDVDARGRAWVGESVNYRSKLHNRPFKRPEGDRIVVLEDTDGDGKADKATTFYQSPDILAPLGIAVLPHTNGKGSTVYVCQSPDLLVFEDADGDLQADGPPKKLLTGFRGFDHDHGLHSVLVGPDRKLYFTVGDTGVDRLKSADGQGKAWSSNGTDVRAGTVWRCEPGGTKLELVAHNFRNNYECCVDSFGTVFLSDNDDDGNQQTRICYVMPGGNYGYHASPRKVSHWNEELPGIVPKILRTYFGSPTGICTYEGALLPEKYRGQLLHTDAGPRHVRCYHLTPQGAGYAAEREDMVQSTDNWFRPSDVCVAPDGSVLVADWYDPGVGGHGMGDTTRGRIFRITPAGHKGYQVPKLDLASNAGVLAALASPNLAARAAAMARVAEMDRAAAVALLRPAAADRANPTLRARALWQLARLGEWAAFDGLLSDPDPRFALLALRAHLAFRGQSPADLSPGEQDLIATAPAPVRREALLGLKDADPEKARPLIDRLAAKYDGQDRFYLCAVGIAVGHHDPKRREVLLADFDRRFPGWNESVAGLVWELRPPAVLPALGKRLADPSLPAAQRALVVDILAAADDKAAGQALLDVLQADVPAEIRDKALENLRLFLPSKWRDLRQSPELSAALDRMLGRPESAPTALTLAAAAERQDLLPRIAALATQTDAPEAVRVAAVKTLGSLPAEAAVAALRGLVPRPAPEAVGVAAVQALAQQMDAGAKRNAKQNPAADALHELVLAGDRPATLRQAAVAGLAGTRPGSNWLLDLNAKSGLPADLKADAARALRGSPFPDLRNKAMVAFPPPGKIDPNKLPSIAVLAARKGDPTKGRQLLAASAKNDMQCLKCHTVRGVGGAVGPDLSMIGKKASRENLLESILLPSKAVADQYINWSVETDKGVTLTGLIVEESPEAIVLRDANGKDTRIPTKEIDSRTRSPNSLMPGDLLVYMTEDELVDLVEHLLTLRTPSWTPDSWRIAGPFDNGPNRAGLDQAFPPEKGVNLKATYPGKAGTVSWRTVRPGAGNYVDLAAFHGPEGNQSVSYLYREFESPAEQEATVLLGTDDGGRLWVNDALVFSTRETRAAAPEQEALKVKLKKGLNRVLLKIDNGNHPHGFYFTVQSEQELGSPATKK